MDGNASSRRDLRTKGLMPIIFVSIVAWACTPAQVACAQLQDDMEVVDRIRTLDDNSFVKREAATRELIEMGEVVVAPLVEQFPALSAEGRYRGLFVLETLSVDRRRNAQRAARVAIETIAADDESSLKQAAELSLLRINQWRAEKTLEDLAAEGATIEYGWEYNNGAQIRIPELVRIDDQWQGEVESLYRLAWLENVNQVELHGKRITNEVVRFALEAQGLTALRLKDASITDELWVDLAKQDKLVPLFALELKYIPISDQALDAIGQIQTLQVVALYGTKVTRAGSQRLANMIPGAEIDFRQGGFLGVRGVNDLGMDLTQTRCLISSIEPESAAAESRLKAGDIILEANGSKVTSIEGLIDIARPLQPGDAITLKVERGSEIFDERIVLGRWE